VFTYFQLAHWTNLTAEGTEVFAEDAEETQSLRSSARTSPVLCGSKFLPLVPQFCLLCYK